MLDYFKYFDEACAVVICYWCAHRMTYMAWTKTPCVDILSIALIGGGAMFHVASPFYGWRLDATFGDPMLWAGLVGWNVIPSVRKWADQKHYRHLQAFLRKKAW